MSQWSGFKWGKTQKTILTHAHTDLSALAQLYC